MARLVYTYLFLLSIYSVLRQSRYPCMPVEAGLSTYFTVTSYIYLTVNFVIISNPSSTGKARISRVNCETSNLLTLIETDKYTQC